MREEVARSLKLNRDLSKMLQQGIELDRPIKIGWTRDGEPIPKQGEIGLAPGLPDRGRVRLLGDLGPMTAILCHEGSFALEGGAGDFYGAWNDGGQHVVERRCGDHAGHAMRAGRITIRDGCGDYAGSSMSGGLLLIRGDAGPNLGAGMGEGTIVVNGDVGKSVGTRMTGGRILVSGRCPAPGEGARLGKLSAKERQRLNKQIDDSTLQISADVVCILNDDEAHIGIDAPVKDDIGDWSTISIVPEDGVNRLTRGAPLDTLLVLGGVEVEVLEEAVPALGLDFPLIIRGGEPSDNSRIVDSNPSGHDILHIDSKNLNQVVSTLADAAGLMLDLRHLPPMDSATLDGFIVALRALRGDLAPVLLLDSVSRVENLHRTAKNHPIQGVVVELCDASGLPAAASLPRIGRSLLASGLDPQVCPTFISIPWAATATDILVARGCGASGLVSPPIEDRAALGDQLRWWLEELGIDSIEKIERKHLRANDEATANLSGLRLAGYERALPMWFSQ